LRVKYPDKTEKEVLEMYGVKGDKNGTK